MNNIAEINTIKDAFKFVKSHYKNPSCSDIRNLCETIFFTNHSEISEDDLMIMLGIGE